MRWTKEQYDAYQARRVLSGAKPEPVVCHDPLAAPCREAENPRRIAVIIKSYRRRLLDPDNLAGGAKFFIDGLRYSKLIPDDSPEAITLQVSQEKVKSKSEERTEIELL